ncbi:hypothetical protein KY285_008546 [Solanum tuberosum]|nr:hypothetical protein KY285_008546 [Solanum tuberosum]
MIGKLEQAKSYLLVEAMRPINPLPLGFFDDLPMDLQQPAPIDAPQLQQAAPVADGLQVADGVAYGVGDGLQVADGQQVADGVADGQQVADGVVDGVDDGLQVADGQQGADGVADGPQVPDGVADGQQVDDDSRWIHSWDLSDEHHFVWMTPTPVPWFTTMLTNSMECQFLEINTPDANNLLDGSPPKCFIKAPVFSSVGMPVTLTSSKLFELDNITTCPGVLISIAQGIRYALFWQALGNRFDLPSTIHLSYQWKSFGWKHKLFITIESVSAQAGTSNQTVGRKRRNRC